MSVRTCFLSAILALVAASTAFAGPQEEGERLFLENRPKEALPLLEAGLRLAPESEKLWLYLGMAYQQVGKQEDAISTLRKGLQKSGQYRHLFLFNIGNCYMATGRSAFAEATYSEAIAIDPSFAPAYLNRANARVNLGRIMDAAGDYRLYLSLDPASPQRREIERFLSLAESMAAAEEARLAAEQAALLAAQQAQQALLLAIQQSLQAAAGDTTSLSAGQGQAQGYDETLDIQE